MATSPKSAGTTGRFCEVEAPEHGQQNQYKGATVRIEMGKVYIEIRDAEAGLIQGYLLDVLARSC